VLAALLEHRISPGEKVLGVSLDGYGYGDDGTAWGAEFLLADYDDYQRLGHFKYMPLPGGDLAAKQPWRMAIAYLYEAYGKKGVEKIGRVSAKKKDAVVEMIERSINSPMASSCGRLFDAVSFLVGLAPGEMEFEAEAPMRLESAADECTQKHYRFTLIDDFLGKNWGQAPISRGGKKLDLAPIFRKSDQPPFQISFAPTIRAIMDDLSRGVSTPQISAKFHNTLAHVILKAAERTRQNHRTEIVALTGGVFLNKRLLTTTKKLLERKGFKTLRPIIYSPNDESISVGQIAYALNLLQK
jgi:hydrogenase maturation protein HypF